MAPILHEARMFHDTLWTELWSDILHAIHYRRRRSTPSRRHSKRIVPLEQSKFQVEYVSFPKLQDEDEDVRRMPIPDKPL
ncbi:hypothetical protein VTP01DRAFT_4407 [Rhizomucor pusillus]|uniref:uncharacterized protein n=1 Tax=Rhizomucor pusillus TaxID=4840 RepID=UPI0037448492